MSKEAMEVSEEASILREFARPLSLSSLVECIGPEVTVVLLGVSLLGSRAPCTRSTHSSLSNLHFPCPLPPY